MDVTCERCGTEYEFDETLVSERGTTVKCTHCGHLFKVFRSGGSGEERPWILRSSDGTEERLGSLRELQQRITHGHVDPTDRISRSGEAFKPLGEIAELQTFFRAAAAAKSAAARGSEEAPTEEPRKQTLFGVGVAPSVPTPPAPPGLRPASAPPPKVASPVARRAETPSRSGHTRPAPASDVETTAPHPAAKPLPRREPAPTLSAEDGPNQPVNPKPVAARAPKLDGESVPAHSPVERKNALYLDEGGYVPTPPTTGRTGLWVFLILLVAVGIAAALQWDRVSTALGFGEEPDPIAQFMAEGDRAFATDTEESYEDAVREYTRATALADNDPRVLVSLARAEAAWAQALAFRASDLEAQVDDPPGAGRASVARAEQRRHAQAAKGHAEAALALNSNDGAAELALSDAHRLLGDGAAAQTHLDRAMDRLPETTADAQMSRALLVAGDTLAAALPGARDAAQVAGAPIRAKLLLARAQLATGDIDAARRTVQAILAAHPENDAARALASAIDEGRPPALAAVVADAGVDAGQPEPEPERAPPTERAPSAERGGPPQGGRDYSWYIDQGNDLLQRGDTGRAREHFQMAIEQRPGAVEAMTGLGYVALRSGRMDEAARFFRPAVRNEYGDAFIGLGEVLRRMGRNAEAIATYEAYLVGHSSGTQAGLARRQIEALRATNSTADEPETATMEAATMEAATMETTTMETATMETAPGETASMETATMETASMETATMDTAPAPTPAPLGGGGPTSVLTGDAE